MGRATEMKNQDKMRPLLPLLPPFFFWLKWSGYFNSFTMEKLELE